MRKLLIFVICAGAMLAHPMGNFSVNHFARFYITEHGIRLQYVLDLAEIPTLDLLRNWDVDRSAGPEEINPHAKQQAREWLRNLVITVNSRPVQAQFESARAVIADGAGNLPILRMEMRARIASAGGVLAYEDRNYAERAGWKEIVVVRENGASLMKTSQSDKDLSKALTQYPPDPTIAPPQDLRAEFTWKANQRVAAPATVVASIPQPHQAPAAVAPATMTAQGAPKGSVIRGDFLSQLLKKRDLSLPMILLALAAAFGLGALHALTPGHGKAIVAAYLVGSRGTLRHAVFLGAMVTFTHTIMVFALGLATLFLFRFIVPEKVTVILGALSGLTIVLIGAAMLRKRIRQAAHARAHQHGHTHHHHHDHHSHTHSHVPEEISWGALIALGASGGLVPCESALVLLLGAIALGRVGFGLLLLLSFSLGLALVLMSIGVLVLYAKNLLPKSTRSRSASFFRWVSVASPAIVMIVGMLVTAASLGWIQPKWMIG
jgi:nickel/cobalt exporter